MHIYAFGSVCRGEIDNGSDIDLLALVDTHMSTINPNDYSIYSYSRVNELWLEGNPFAWHLHHESKLIYSSDGVDYISKLDKPAPYINGEKDCIKFYEIFKSATASLKESELSCTFDLSSIFLAIRNIATCFSLSKKSNPSFSRHSAKNIGEQSLMINNDTYSILERSRIICTRAIGENISKEELNLVNISLPSIESWMIKLITEVKSNE